MKYTLQDNTLTLFLVGEIASSNADEVWTEIENETEGKSFDRLVLDFLDVKYVSSAGLRVILRCKQKHKETSIVNASLDVYDILQMTGFTTIMKVHKAIAKVEVNPDQIVGEGFCGTVYRISKDTIVKVYKNASIEDIEREMALAKEAFILGIPTAITFDIVQVGDKLGVRFEMIDSISLRDAFRDYPHEYDALIRDYGDLLKTINTTETDNPNLPSAREAFVKKAKTAGQYLDKKDTKKLLDMAEAIPERKTFVHGDCHVKNVLCQNHELFLIDMDTLSVGDPVFELSGIYATYIAFEEASPGNNIAFLGLDEKLSRKLYLDTLDRYFGGMSEDQWNRIMVAAYTHMLWWIDTFDPENDNRRQVMTRRLKETLPLVKELSLA